MAGFASPPRSMTLPALSGWLGFQSQTLFPLMGHAYRMLLPKELLWMKKAYLLSRQEQGARNTLPSTHMFTHINCVRVWQIYSSKGHTANVCRSPSLLRLLSHQYGRSILEDSSAESYVDCEGPAQEVSEENKVSEWARGHSWDALKSLSAFCP